MVLTRSYKHEDLREESTMNTMLRWSPTRQFHFHPDVNDLSERFFGGATEETAHLASWLPAAEGRMEDGTYVIQLALPGVDPQDVEVSLMHSGPRQQRRAAHPEQFYGIAPFPKGHL